MGAKAVAGGGRLVAVPPERLERWIAGFVQRHGELTGCQPDGAGIELVAADGARAICHPAFPPLLDRSVSGLLGHAQADRRVGLLLVRLGGHAAGVFHGRELIASKVGSRQVHGRSAAGGWSQQRFARRREGQVAVAQQAAADVAVRILLPAPYLAAIVTGGDRMALAAVLADRRLESLRPLVVERVLEVVDPRHDVLVRALEQARSAQITVFDPV